MLFDVLAAVGAVAGGAAWWWLDGLKQPKRRVAHMESRRSRS